MNRALNHPQCRLDNNEHFTHTVTLEIHVSTYSLHACCELEPFFERLEQVVKDLAFHRDRLGNELMTVDIAFDMNQSTNTTVRAYEQPAI